MTVFIALLQHWHLDTVTLRSFDGDLIARVGVPNDTHAWVRCKNSFQPASRFRRPVRNDDLSGMLANIPCPLRLHDGRKPRSRRRPH